ncbi:mitochondrial ribosome-associated GTPase 2 isoform X2 [Bombus vosnesenskii]|uniref:Mitochondrial ribosome-associated GTPase 2 isoform X2 n=1 Tax=Bombus vosnesenskii TaxID=207650 RepID=A0A6J3JTG1_9HYME|nr:mitochondrial ribosome-associated GTPase 2 isoform X2 [Bombus vosnesenskii]
MKITMFNENDCILLVGEGNFSFSVALFHLNLKINITATCYEANVDQELGKKNIEYLKSNGVCVLLGVDATNLKEHPILKTKLFNKIIFNFPHVGGKMRIEKNRELLRQFFISASEILKSNGQVLVTLCNGQGGTAIDNPPRRWDDSWKIIEMAAHGNFVLTAIEPFVWSSFQSYIVTGYRSLDKQFHSAGALTHIFIKSKPPTAKNIAPKKKINILECNRNNFSWKDISQITNISHINATNIDTHINKNIFKSFCTFKRFIEQKNVPKPLRSIKPRAQNDADRSILDLKQVRTIGGKGGDGEISFLQLWSNENAGPDGGDGGHGGHIIFETSLYVKDLSHISSVLKAEDGEKGYNKSCFGKNAKHTIVPVPIGTIIRNMKGSIIADLSQEGMMFIAARGGAGGHGNAFFKSDVQQSPCISEYGADGEDLQYVLEISSMAHVGLIGFPNAGKSTLLRAISRARPKVAAYQFTTLKPHLGIILYDDHEQVTVADLPGLIPDSHKNRGLGIQFLKHAERCKVLLFILDVASDEPWRDFETLKYEIAEFNVQLNKRLHLIAANKIDLPGAMEKLEILKQKINLPIIPISAKMGTNISTLLREIRILYDKEEEESKKENVL